jgi:hypothetical protein
LTLTLSEQESAELERRATAAGTDVKTFLLHVVNDVDMVDDQAFSKLPYDQWKQDFQQWLQGHRTRNVHMDDSRESIYD